MKIFLHEISDENKELHFTSADAWVQAAVVQFDEKTPGRPAGELFQKKNPEKKSDKTEPPARLPNGRRVNVDFSLNKVDDVVIVQGDVQAQVQLLCSRCASPFLSELHPVFQVLYTKDPQMAGLDSPGGHARHAHDEDERNIDISFLPVEYIDLSEVLTEQLQLMIPFQPLCKSDCKGICGNCGADLNRGRCPCGKLATLKPFAALKDLKNKAST